jgi:hypothetical protein
MEILSGLGGRAGGGGEKLPLFSFKEILCVPIWLFVYLPIT